MASNDKKGFSGLGDLVTDVSKDLETSEDAEQALKQGNDSAAKSQEVQTSPNLPQVHSKSNGTQIPERLSRDKGGAPSWVWAVISILVIIGFANMGEKKEIAPSSSELPSIDPPTPNSSYYSSTQPSGLDNKINESFTEDKPPIGTDFLLTRNQLRYCFSEGIRLDAIKKALDAYSQFEVDSFNRDVEDYNSRCGHFRYRPGSLESVRSEVDSVRASLVVEGLDRLESWGGRASQKQSLNSSNDTVVSAPVNSDAQSAGSNVFSRPDISGLSVQEKDSIEMACSYDKTINGPAAYNNCLSAQLRKLR